METITVTLTKAEAKRIRMLIEGRIGKCIDTGKMDLYDELQELQDKLRSTTTQETSK